MEEKIYKIEVLSVFKMTYYIKAKCQEHALDEYVCSKDTDDFKEGAQCHLDEIFSDVKELSEEEFIADFDMRNSYLKNSSLEEKLEFVNEIDYSV